MDGKAGQGVAKFSIHKTGLAVDLGGAYCLYGQKSWRVMYEEDNQDPEPASGSDRSTTT